MADQDHSGEGAGNQYGEQQMYAQDGGYDNGPSGDSGQELKKKDDDDRKIFVGGLSWDTTEKDLKDYFGNYGDVLDSTLKTDPVTGRSRGFGFVLFSDNSSVDKVVKQSEPHALHGRTIDPKRAHARPKPEPVKKVFVGGLDPSTSEDEIKAHFEKYGKVMELDLPYDKMKQQRRAFCFITFDNEDMAEKACWDPKQMISGKEVDVKKATPRQDGQGGWGQQSWGGYGGRGGRGGFDRGRGGRGRGRGGNQGQGWNQGGWGGGQQSYDYNSYYPNYGSGGSGQYDYYNTGNYGSGNNYYDNYYNQGWNNYNTNGTYSNYQNTGSYDGYGSWYGNAGQQGGQQQTQQASNYGKQKTTGQGGGRGGGSYHPYARQ